VELTMALGGDTIDILLRLHKDGYLKGPTSIVEIGAQQLGNGFLRARDGIELLGQLFGVTTRLDLPQPQTTQIVDGGIEHLLETAPLARLFWEWLGFRYAAIDIDGSPDSIPLDLNFDSIPHWATKKFDVVTNFGTTEHVANQLNAFKVIHELTAHNGIMIHNLPAQGFVNHGLVNYNPKWFWMLARSNDYRWLYFDYSGSDHATDLPHNVKESIMPYTPDIAVRGSRYKVVDGSMTAIFQKTRDIEYVPPLDVSTGTTTSNEALLRRYWTVLASPS
jgi:SAM-dependent methyltransferase